MEEQVFSINELQDASGRSVWEVRDANNNLIATAHNETFLQRLMGMSSEERMSAACFTEAKIGTDILERLHNTARLIHAAMGMVTEAGEFLDMLKKHIYYGKPLDVVNLKEEIGDMDWYQAIACHELKTSMAQIQQTNVEKLLTRYKKKQFEKQAAIERDLAAERSVLEG